MKNGQQALDNKQFADAKRFFMGASKLKPKDNLPKEKLKETELLWANFIEEEKLSAKKKQAEDLENNYNGFVMSADQAFQNEMWEEAIQSYQEAGKLKPEEGYPKERLALSKENKDAAIALALKKQQEEAARLKKEDLERIRLEEEAAKLVALEEKFNLAMTNGDEAMESDNYKLAVSSYRKAVELKPEEQEARRKYGSAMILFKEFEAFRIAEAKRRKKLAAIELKKRKEAARIAREAYLAEINKNSPAELAKRYPDGISEEAEIIDHTLITKSIIIEKGEGRYLLKFDYPWGEHFYYLNGKKIREDTYNWNIRKYKF